MKTYTQKDLKNLAKKSVDNYASEMGMKAKVLSYEISVPRFGDSLHVSMTVHGQRTNDRMRPNNGGKFHVTNPI